jgi:hypothetical protein
MAKRINRGTNSHGTPGAPPPPTLTPTPEEDCMADVRFTAADLASCRRFCREMEVFLREEARRFRKRLRASASVSTSPAVSSSDPPQGTPACRRA